MMHDQRESERIGFLCAIHGDVVLVLVLEVVFSRQLAAYVERNLV